MKTEIKAVGIGLLTAGGLLSLLWLFIHAVITSINTLQSSVAGSIVAASIAATAAFLVNVYTKHKEARDKLLQEIRAKKTPVYEELIDVIFLPLLGEQQGRAKPTDEEIKALFAKLTPKIVVWGSQDIISHWNKIRSQNWTGIQDPKQVFGPWNELLLLIRKDLGQKNNKLEPFALMKLFVNDMK